MKSSFHPFLKLAASGDPLDTEDMKSAMSLLLAGEVSDIEIAGFLMALRARGEHVDEIAAAAAAMRALATKVEAPSGAVDTAGTGGDGANTYNISTAAALIAAGAGASVAKHGNKAASSQSGSSDILAKLGVNLNASPQTISTCITQAGIGFMFAAYHHQAVANVANVRKNLGVRTIFNILGPLTNPAGAKRQVMGVFDKMLLPPIAQTLKSLGSEKAWVVHGSDGLDELTTTGPSYVCALDQGVIREFTITPEDAGLKQTDSSALKGGTPEQNAKALKDVLNGEKGAYRDIALLNAAATLIVADKANTLKEGMTLATQSIESGMAARALDNLVQISNNP